MSEPQGLSNVRNAALLAIAKSVADLARVMAIGLSDVANAIRHEKGASDEHRD